MPAARRISRDEIIDAAVEVLRDGGFSAVNARSVAKKLGCSAQPIYLSFKSMDELKTALTERAIGGRDGGGSRLTREGKELLEKYEVYRRRCDEACRSIWREVFSELQ